ncbi:MAG TPA: hypothetical protein EYP04_12725, partial [Anaerolineae bacterium]|nr:hypothetical protein [Anaerolineae bacterium]
MTIPKELPNPDRIRNNAQRLELTIRNWIVKARQHFNGHWPLWLILGVAFLLRLWGSKTGLPYLYNPGESIVVRQALAYGSGTLHPYSFIYPPLYSYLLFGLYGAYFLVGKLWGIFPTIADFAISYFL